MIPPVRCYTCNRVLGHLYKHYNSELDRKKLALNTTEDPLIININAVDIKKTIAGETMDDLGLIRICCRKVVMTSLDIIDEI